MSSAGNRLVGATPDAGTPHSVDRREVVRLPVVSHPGVRGSSHRWLGMPIHGRGNAWWCVPRAPHSGKDGRDDSRCSFVNETARARLALELFPQLLHFEGDAVLQLVQPGLCAKRRSP